MSKPKNKPTKSRIYNAKVVTYATPQEFAPLLAEAEHWVYICHDKDVYTADEARSSGNDVVEGDPKPTHFHILLKFATAKTFSAIRKYVRSEQNTFVQPSVDPVGDYDYLTHDNAPNKYQYDKSSLVSACLVYWEQRANLHQNDEQDDFVTDLLDGRLSRRQMAHKYGRDYMRNFSQYEAFRLAVIHEESYAMEHVGPPEFNGCERRACDYIGNVIFGGNE